MRLFGETREQAKQAQYAEKIMRYGDLLLINPDGSTRVAVVDTISQRRKDNATTTSRMSFYREKDEYRLDESHENNPRPTTRRYVRWANRDETAEGQTAGWIAGTELLEWRRFSPEPTDDIRPFLKLLEQCFGTLPE